MDGRRAFLVGGAFWAACAAAAEAQNLGDILGAVAKSSGGGGGKFSEGEASGGLRQALTNGVIVATTKLGKVDGFYKNSRFHIPLPGSIGKVQKALQPMGMAGPFDEVELKMNRAAEQSMPTAKKLFINAVNSITITDAIGIVRGGDRGGTDFLRGKTEPNLTTLLRPKMQSMLQTTGAFTSLDRATSSGGGGLGSLGPLTGALGGGGSLGGDLKGQVVNFAVAKCLDGAFGYIGDEESAIRHDPVKRGSALLQKVFG